MFAPPPAATLSRAEIQAKRAELRAKRASSTGGSSFNSTTTSELQTIRTSDSQQAPKPKKAGRFSSSGNGGGVEEIREADKETWKFKKPKLGSKKSKSIKDGGSGISLPATLLPPPPPPPPGPPSLRSDAGSFVESIVEEPSAAERRDKPAPPKRPARPSGELFLSPPLSAAMSDAFPRALTPESFAGSSFRSASVSPAAPPPFQAPPSVPGAYPMMATVNTGSPRPPPLPSPPMPSPPMLSSSSPMLTGPASPPPSTPPPPIPERSPLRQQRPTRPSSNPATSNTPRLDGHRKQQAMSSDAALSSAMAELKMAMRDPITIGQGEQQFPPQPLQAATEPEEPSLLTGIQPLQVRKGTKGPAESSLQSGTGSSKAIAGVETASPATSPARPVVALSKAQRIAKQGLRRQVATHRRGSLGASVRLTRAQKKPKTPIVSTQPRKGNGETFALLQTSDFFRDANEVVHSGIPAHASFIDRDLPDTPNSIAPTPTELYEPSHAPFGGVPKGRTNSGSALRSPLSVVSDTNAKSNSLPTQPSPPNAASDGHRL